MDSTESIDSCERERTPHFPLHLTHSNVILLPGYIGILSPINIYALEKRNEATMAPQEATAHQDERTLTVERVQIGVRMEKRMLKVLKGLAEYLDITLGDLLEGITLHAFESQTPFNEETRRRIAQLKDVYGMDYGAEASHRFVELTTAKDGS